MVNNRWQVNDLMESGFNKPLLFFIKYMFTSPVWYKKHAFTPKLNFMSSLMHKAIEIGYAETIFCYFFFKEWMKALHSIQLHFSVIECEHRTWLIPKCNETLKVAMGRTLLLLLNIRKRNICQASSIHLGLSAFSTTSVSSLRIQRANWQYTVTPSSAIIIPLNFVHLLV